MLEGWHGRTALCVRDREISKCPPGSLGAAEKELKRGRFYLQPQFCGVVIAQDEVDGAEWV